MASTAALRWTQVLGGRGGGGGGDGGRGGGVRIRGRSESNEETVLHGGVRGRRRAEGKR